MSKEELKMYAERNERREQMLILMLVVLVFGMAAGMLIMLPVMHKYADKVVEEKVEERVQQVLANNAIENLELARGSTKLSNGIVPQLDITQLGNKDGTEETSEAAQESKVLEEKSGAYVADATENEETTDTEETDDVKRAVEPTTNISLKVNILSDTTVYKEGKETSTKIEELKQGDKIIVTDEVGGGWLRIKHNGTIGYIYYLHTDYADRKEVRLVKNDKYNEGTVGEITADNVALRCFPGEGTQIVETLGKDEKITLLARGEIVKGEKEGWYRAITEKGNEGFVYGEYVYVDVNESIRTAKQERKANNEEELTVAENNTKVTTNQGKTNTEVNNSKKTNTSVTTNQSKTNTEVNNNQKTNSNVAANQSKDNKEANNNTISEVEVTGQQIIMYQKTDFNSKQLVTINPGSKLTEVKEAGRGFLKCKYGKNEGYVYYLYTNYAERTDKKLLIENNETANATVSANKVNLREKPGITTKVVDCLSKGTKLRVISFGLLIEGEAKGWFKVRDTKTGKEGYMYGQYVHVGTKVTEEDVKTTNKTKINQLGSSSKQLEDVTDEDITLLAKVMIAEAGGCGEKEMKYVGQVLINRVNINNSSLTTELSRKGQYPTTWNKIKNGKITTTKEAREYATELLNGENGFEGSEVAQKDWTKIYFQGNCKLGKFLFFSGYHYYGK